MVRLTVPRSPGQAAGTGGGDGTRVRGTGWRRDRVAGGVGGRGRVPVGVWLAAWGAGVGGLQDEGGGGLAGEQVEVGAGAQGVQGAGDPGGLEGLGQGGEVLVGGQRGGGGQVAAGQRRGAGGSRGHLRPGVFQRLLFSLAGGPGVGGQRPAPRARARSCPLVSPGAFPMISFSTAAACSSSSPASSSAITSARRSSIRPAASAARVSGSRSRLRARSSSRAAWPGQSERDGDLVIHMVKRPPVPALGPSASRRAARRDVAASLARRQAASRFAACRTPVS